MLSAGDLAAGIGQMQASPYQAQQRDFLYYFVHFLTIDC
jgi:hypothetical protein